MWESSIILHQCHHHLRGPSQWSVSHSGLTAGHQSPVGAMLWVLKVLATDSSLLRPVSLGKLSIFRIIKDIADFAHLHDNWSGSGQSKVRFALYLPKTDGSLLKVKYWAVRANMAGTSYAWQKQTFFNACLF